MAIAKLFPLQTKDYMWILFLPFLNSWLKVEVNDLDMQFLDNVNKLKELIDSQTIHWTTFFAELHFKLFWQANYYVCHYLKNLPFFVSI